MGAREEVDLRVGEHHVVGADFSRAATQTKMLFVNFAYTGCKPCHDLMPHWSEAGLAMLNQTPPVIFSQVDVKSDGGSKLGALYVFSELIRIL